MSKDVQGTFEIDDFEIRLKSTRELIKDTDRLTKLLNFHDSEANVDEKSHKDNNGYITNPLLRPLQILTSIQGAQTNWAFVKSEQRQN